MSPASPPATDAIVRWVHPNRPSGGGGLRRSRDNGDLQRCLGSIAAFMPWVRQVHVVHAGPPPRLQRQPYPFPTRLRVVDEARLFEHAARHFGVTPLSSNSEPVKVALPFLPDLAPRFLTFDDDYLVTRFLEPERFFDAQGRALLPRVLQDCHRPLPFVTGAYLAGLEAQDPALLSRWLRSGPERRDPFGVLCCHLVAQECAAVDGSWRTIRNNQVFGHWRELWDGLRTDDWAHFSVFLGKLGRGAGHLRRLQAWLERARQRRPASLTVNDHFDERDALWYDRQVTALQDFAEALLPSPSHRSAV